MMTDFERIVGAIELVAQQPTPPDPPQLAAQLGLKPAALRHLIGRWAGTTPEQFLQFLTLDHTRNLLRQHPPTNRQPIQLVAAPTHGPAALGAGLTIRAGMADTPFGRCLIGDTAHGICHLAFLETGCDALAELRAVWPHAAVVADDPRARKLAAAIFQPLATANPDPWQLYLRATPFQLRIWRKLGQVPAGAVTSYRQLAIAAGCSNACRATGSAVAANSVAFLIPCHRVIRDNGQPGQFRWGSLRKRALLAWESSHCNTRVALA